MAASAPLSRLGPCVAAAALLVSLNAHADTGTSCNGGTGEGGTNVAGLPGVCGQIQGQGNTYGATFGAVLPATFTVTGNPLQYGLTPVAISGVVAGTGVFGGVSVSGDFGQAHISAAANDTNPHNAVDSSRMYTQGNIGFEDGFTVGASDVEARFTVALDGGVSIGAAGNLYFDLYDVTPYQGEFVAPEVHLGLTYLTSSASRTLDLDLLAGHSYDLAFALEADAIASEDFLTNIPASLADLSNTGTLNIDLVTPGQSLTFLSGHDYRTNAVVMPPPDPGTPVGTGSSTIPEPAGIPLFLIGLAGVGFVARRPTTRAGAGPWHGLRRLGAGFLPAGAPAMA